MKHERGFTLIEALISVGVVLVVGLMAAFAVRSARATARDAVRLSNIRQIQVALENVYQDANTYPEGVNIPLGDAVESACLGTDGFAGTCQGAETVYIRAVPGAIETGLSGEVGCGTPLRKAFCYSLLQEGKGYAISFELEHDIPYTDLVKGVNCALPDGLRQGACPAP